MAAICECPFSRTPTWRTKQDAQFLLQLIFGFAANLRKKNSEYFQFQDSKLFNLLKRIGFCDIKMITRI